MMRSWHKARRTHDDSLQNRCRPLRLHYVEHDNPPLILRILGGFTLFTDVDGRAFTWYNEPNVKAKTKENYSYVPQYLNGLMKQLSRQGVPAKDDRELMADRFCLPFP